MRRSQASARDKPAPAAAPGMAASVGLGISCSSRAVSIDRRNARTLPSSPVSANSAPSAIAFTSPPAQKAPPAPVSTTAPTAGSLATRSSRESIASSIAVDMALRRSGRFMVRVATRFSTVTSRSSVISRLLCVASRGAAACGGRLSIHRRRRRGEGARPRRTGCRREFYRSACGARGGGPRRVTTCGPSRTLASRNSPNRAFASCSRHIMLARLLFVRHGNPAPGRRR